MTSGSRKYYVVGEQHTTVRPRFDAALSVRANVVAIAAWEWGERRAQWVAALADDLGEQAAEVADDAPQWVAAILCAAAADMGRDRKPGWYRTLTAISEMTGVSRENMLTQFAQLRALRPTG